LNKKIYILIIFIACFSALHAQVVNISQPYISAQLSSPASVGDGLYTQRIQSDIRTQIIDGSNLYNTAIVAWDRKIKNLDPEQNNYLGFGAQIVSDRLMNGLVQFNTLSVNFAYHIYLDKNLYNNVSIGLGGLFSQISLDRSNLKFADQYYSTGVPTGAGSMENLKDFPSNASVNTGILYTRHAETSFFKLGASLFFFEKPQVTNSYLNESAGVRKLIFLNAESTIFYDYTLLVHGFASEQNNIQKLIGGVALSFPITKNWEEIKRMYIGCAYKKGECISPTVSFLMNHYMLGFSYDINNNSLPGSQLNHTNFEVSFSRSFGNKKSDLFRTLFD
jgi:type IX secretion system PorP/SprF family membrane protein